MGLSRQEESSQEMEGAGPRAQDVHCHLILGHSCITGAMHVTVTAKGAKLQLDPLMPGGKISSKIPLLILHHTGIVGSVTVAIPRILKSKSSSSLNIKFPFPGYSQSWCGQRQHKLLTPLPGTCPRMNPEWRWKMSPIPTSHSTWHLLGSVPGHKWPHTAPADVTQPC